MEQQKDFTNIIDDDLYSVEECRERKSDLNGNIPEYMVTKAKQFLRIIEDYEGEIELDDAINGRYLITRSPGVIEKCYIVRDCRSPTFVYVRSGSGYNIPPNHRHLRFRCCPTSDYLLKFDSRTQNFKSTNKRESF